MSSNKDKVELENAVIEAVLANNLQSLKNLVEKGCSVNSTNDHGFTPLHIAVRNEFTDIINYLIGETDCCLDAIDSGGETPLFKSLSCNSPEPAVALITAGADVKKPTNNQRTPLHKAVQMRKSELARLLIEKGADVNARELVEHGTPLHGAVQIDCYEMVCLLLYYAADAGSLDIYDMTPFMLALARNVGKDIQELLLEYEADVNLVAYNGYSHLLLAMNWQNPLALQLIERGADINYHDGSKNVINFLSMYTDDEIFESIWSTIEPRMIEETKSSSQFSFGCLVTWESWCKRLWSILRSDKAEVFVRKHGNILSRMIDVCKGRLLEEDELYPLVCMCLMYGATVTYQDFCELYRQYGYNKIAKLLLHVGITAPSVPNNVTLPYFICSVRRPSCSMCLARRHGRGRNINLELSKYVSVFFVMCKKRAGDLGVEVSVPSLKEFAREATRCAIAERFKKNTLMFYTIVHKLAIPEVLKKFIGYEIPI